MYENTGAQVFRTDEHSDLAIVLDKGDLKVIGRK